VVDNCRGTLAGVRWAALFDDLESQAESGRRAERAGTAADLARAEISRVRLADRLRAAAGTPICVAVSGDAITGVPTHVGPDWALLTTPAGEVLVVLSAADWWSDLPLGADQSSDAVADRLGLGHALRRLARDRAAVAIGLRSRDTRIGTIDRVGADFVDLAEHARDVVRRRNEVTGIRTLGFDAIATVRPA
jgi:hypothetical protein